MNQSIAYYAGTLTRVLFRCYENGELPFNGPPSLNRLADANLIKVCCCEIMRISGATNYRYNRVIEEYVDVSSLTPAEIKAFEQQQVEYANLKGMLAAANSRALAAEAKVTDLQYKLQILESQEQLVP